MNKQHQSINTKANNRDHQGASSPSQSIENLDPAELDKVIGGAGGIFGTDIIDWTYFKRQILSHL